MTKLLNFIVLAILGGFFLMSMFFRLTEGSFEGAGERLDVIFGQAAEDAPGVAEAVAKQSTEIAKDVAETTDRVVTDIADGPDEPNR